MNDGARKVKADPAREAAARAPAGPPLTAEERERVAKARAAIARGDHGKPHEQIMQELAERQRRGG